MPTTVHDALGNPAKAAPRPGTCDHSSTAPLAATQERLQKAPATLAGLAKRIEPLALLVVAAGGGRRERHSARLALRPRSAIGTERRSDACLFAFGWR